jgi:outer membrane biosynthesis protein TonB
MFSLRTFRQARFEDFMNEHVRWLQIAAFATSAAVHAGAFASLRLASPAAGVGFGSGAVEFAVVAPQAPPPPAVPTAPEPEPERRAPTQPAQALAPPPPAPAAPTKLPPESEPVDLTGVTLTNDGPGNGWSSVVGDGTHMRGPIGRVATGPQRLAANAQAPPQASSAARRREPVQKQAPSYVPVADLSRRPRPPPLNAVLLRNYPPEARRSGQGGLAMVAARIGPDGRVGSPRIVSESAPGFGRACVRTLLGSVWTPPLDRNGRAVATRISYTCRFQVTR